jgi:hypothetical protein
MQFRCPVSALTLRLILFFSVLFLPVAVSSPLLAAGETQPPALNQSTTHLTFNPACGMVNQSIILTAKVIGIASGTGTGPTGTVTFTQGSNQLGMANLDPTTGIATLPTSFGTAGNYSITATYSGDTNYMPSMDTETLQIGTTCLTATTTSLSINPNPAQVGESVTIKAQVSAGTGLLGMITGTVDFLQDGTQIGTGTLDPTSNTATFTTSFANTGMFSMTARYEGDNQKYLGSTSPAVNLSIVPVGTLTPTTTTLSSSNPNSNFGDTVNFTANVSGGMGSGPTGTVTFLDGSTSLGTGTLVAGISSSSFASFSTNSLSIGTHTITAQYGGDSNFAGSTSSPLTQNVGSSSNQTFIISINPGVLNVNQGSSGTATITVSPAGGFNQPVTFVCSNLPLFAACSFDPATVTPDGSNHPVTSTLTVTTGSAKALLMRPVLGPHGSLPKSALAVFSVGLMGLVQVKERRKKPGRRGVKSIASWLLFSLCLLGCLWMVACGGSGSNANSVTPKGQTIVTVSGSTATGAQTTTFTLNVQ